MDLVSKPADYGPQSPSDAAAHVQLAKDFGRSQVSNSQQKLPKFLFERVCQEAERVFRRLQYEYSDLAAA